MVKTHEWGKIVLKKQNRTKPVNAPPRRVVGWDTETVGGAARLVTISDPTEDVNTAIRMDGLDASLNVLASKKYGGAINGFWNIDYDFNALVVKYLPQEKAETLYRKGAIHQNGFRLRYIPHKTFSVSRGHHTVRFFDFCQFFGHESLDGAAKKYLGKQKIDIQNKNWDEKAFEARLKEIVRYALLDAELCRKLGEYAQTAFSKAGVDFNRPVSTAGLSERFFRANGYIPTIHDIPNGALEFAFHAYRGGRFECIQKGYFPRLFSHDIKSAYPYQISRLLDPTAGQWEKCSRFIPGAPLGFYRVRLEHDKTPFTLTNDFLRFHYRNVSYFTHGAQTTFLSQPELEFFERQGWGSFQVREGWVFHPSRELHPFRKIPEIYAHRKDGPMQNHAFKVLLNSLYGKMFQLTPDHGNFRAGNLFNPIWAAQVTAGTRVQLLELAVKHPDAVVSFHTDNIMTTRRLTGESEALGDWNYEGQGEGLVMGAGIYSIKNQKETKNKFRGFTSKRDLWALCEEFKRQNKARIVLHRPQTFGTSVLHQKATAWKNLNVFLENPRVLNVHFDKKRIWEPGIETFGDFLRTSVSSDPPRCIF